MGLNILRCIFITGDHFRALDLEPEPRLDRALLSTARSMFSRSIISTPENFFSTSFFFFHFFSHRCVAEGGRAISRTWVVQTGNVNFEILKLIENWRCLLWRNYRNYRRCNWSDYCLKTKWFLLQKVPTTPKLNWVKKNFDLLKQKGKFECWVIRQNCFDRRMFIQVQKSVCLST